MRSAVLFQRPDGAIFLHAPKLGLIAGLRAASRGSAPRIAALLRSEGDLRRSIRLAQQALALAMLAELAACDVLRCKGCSPRTGHDIEAAEVEPEV